MRQVYISPERMTIQKLEKYPAPFQDSNFDHCKEFWQFLARFQEIEDEFKLLDTDQSGWLSIQEIEQHLRRKGCDAQLIQEIFNDLNTNMDQKISKDEFTHGYLIKEQNLKNDVKLQELKILELRKTVDDLKQQDKSISQLTLIPQSGCLTQYYNSYQDIEKAARQIQINVTCEDSVDGHERISKPSLNCEFPVWGDKLQYLLHGQLINLSIELIEIHKMEKKQLMRLQFQKTFNEDYDKQEKILFDNIGDILVQVQYIRDLKQYSEFQIELIENQIRQLFEETKQLKKKLHFMSQLYVIDSSRPKLLSSLNPQPLLEIKPIEPQIQIQTPQTDINKQEMVQAETIHLDYQEQAEFVDAFNIFKHSISDPEDIIINLDTLNNEQRFKILCTLLGIITINITFGHVDYLGLLLVLYCIPYQNKKWNTQQIKFYTVSTIFSLILDFYWLIKYVNCFSNSDQCNNEYGMVLLIYFLGLLTFFGKIYVLYKIRQY